ncbi:BZ3500_MvSof-1268-A1-R1_Chr1-3g02047 [Microbotryum saponariae]|uniref:BZ3500_MvSof-1268-A1-R1_Chr1-3g02047 protein n=1 Tax=Microbotryum saponariae TaxID=289078 RepID=A0A2X0KB59_9BASI|nr:BZ3500_MvSof-1268-A1-R1_Chr1-3g02047 [Microbotryum saponariae]SCZ95253.1 BZ3501_MvSof-1269-A2-R1_Chr1-3g01649 [Microbotryum saponariae]
MTLPDVAAKSVDTTVTRLRSRPLDEEHHLDGAGGWTSWLNRIRGRLGKDIWDCTLAIPIKEPGPHVNLSLANEEVTKLILRSIKAEYNSMLITTAYDLTPAELLKSLKELVGSVTLKDISIRLQLLLDVGAPPTSEAAFAIYMGQVTRLHEELSSFKLSFADVVSCRLLHSLKGPFPAYYANAMDFQVDSIPKPRDILSECHALTGSETLPVAEAKSRPRRPRHPCRHCKGDHWNNDCPKRPKGVSSAKVALEVAPRPTTDASDLLGEDVHTLFTSRHSKLGGASLIVLDIGATHHVVNTRSAFIEFVPCTSESRCIKGVGTAVMRAFDGTVGHLLNAIYVPGGPVSLFSVSRADKAGFSIVFGAGKCSVTRRGVACYTGALINKLYCLNASLVDARASTPSGPSRKVTRVVGFEIAVAGDNDCECAECLAAKITHTVDPSPNKSFSRT